MLIVFCGTQSNRRTNFIPRLAGFNPRLALIVFSGTGARGHFLINSLLEKSDFQVFEEQLKRFRPLRCRMAIIDRQSQLGFCSLPRYIKRNGGIDTESSYPNPCNKAIQHHQLRLPNTKALNIGKSYNQ